MHRAIKKTSVIDTFLSYMLQIYSWKPISAWDLDGTVFYLIIHSCVMGGYIVVLGIYREKGICPISNAGGLTDLGKLVFIDAYV